MFKLIRKIFFEKCRFADPKCKAFDGGGILKCSCGKSGKAPSAPQYQMPSYAQRLPEEQLALIRAQAGKQVTMPREYDIAGQTYQDLLKYSPQLQELLMPREYDIAGQAYQDLLKYSPQLQKLPMPSEYDFVEQGLKGLHGYQPEQFRFPMEDIQKALEAQQALQYEQYQKQINPILASQGQYDSTYRANLLSDFLKNQQAQQYGTTADLLTNQAMQNLDISRWLPQLQSSALSGLQSLGGARSNIDLYNAGIQNELAKWLPQFQSGIAGTIENLGGAKTNINQYNADLQNTLARWLPQFQSGIAGQLAGLGGQRSTLDQFNLQLPFQTTIPALGNVYGQGMQFGDRTTQQANLQYQQDLQSYREAEARKQKMYEQLGSLALAGATGGMSGAAGMLGPASGMAGFGGGFMQGLQGTAGTASLLNQFPGLGMGTGNYQQRTNWTPPTAQKYKPLSIGYGDFKTF